jgi:hypothetical protein
MRPRSSESVKMVSSGYRRQQNFFLDRTGSCGIAGAQWGGEVDSYEIDGGPIAAQSRGNNHFWEECLESIRIVSSHWVLS